jgi:inhibitor of KinA sporulation pathway (predicted exonuclease)
MTSTLHHGKLLVVDIEATCWDTQPPSGQQNEIIEIGACVLDLDTCEITNRRGILVKPERSRVSAFCTQLTTLTQEQVDGGISFRDACALLEVEYDSRALLWGSWGDYDRRMFEWQCASFSVDYPFSKQHINLKELHAELESSKHKQFGMARAMRAARLELEGTHHRGDDDAYNIARLMIYLIQKHGAAIFDHVFEPETLPPEL